MLPDSHCLLGPVGEILMTFVSLILIVRVLSMHRIERNYYIWTLNASCVECCEKASINQAKYKYVHLTVICIGFIIDRYVVR